MQYGAVVRLYHSHALCLTHLSAAKQDFVCSRSLLVEEMVYFADYLSNQPSDDKAEVDISVHCDVNIFTWLMSYVKRGMNEDPFGKKMEQPQETPTLSECSRGSNGRHPAYVSNLKAECLFVFEFVFLYLIPFISF